MPRFLCYEGTEKVYEAISGHHGDDEETTERGPDFEKKMVGDASRTDLNSSAENMIISCWSTSAKPASTGPTDQLHHLEH